MKIKKGKLNYDQSGRAYPPNPRVDENWSCIWEYEGKYYKLVGDNEHKEWDEVNIYNQIIDEAYENYQWKQPKSFPAHPDSNLSKEEFINKCKVDPEFSKRWGLKIEELELADEERIRLYEKKQYSPKEFLSGNLIKMEDIPTKLITLTYNNETIEVYE